MIERDFENSHTYGNAQSEDQDMDKVDYVVVGAGTAGCVVAARLVGAGRRVLLLEAGPGDRHWSIQMPAAFGQNFQGGRYNYGFWSTPQQHLGGRTLFQPRGKVLGGSSSINGQVFLRGHALDYDRWASKGAEGWSYADVLPYFRRVESYAGPSSEYRGASGPVTIRRGDASNPVNAAFVEAGVQAGYARTSDVNGFQQEGFGVWDMNIANGVRASSSFAYIKPLVSDPNLVVKTECKVERVDFSNKRAVGLSYRRGGDLHTVKVEEEIILCGGAVHSPQLLMLAGIGPADHLRAHGIKVLADSPGVGQNLQDHLYMMMQYHCTKPITLNRYRRWDKRLGVGLNWLARKAGPGGTNHVEVGAFFRSRPGVRHPDVQIHFKPVLLENWDVSKSHGFNFGISTMRPTSTGTVRLASADPNAAPVIDPNYLSTEDDVVDMRNTVKLTREIAGQRAFDGLRGAPVGLSADIRSDAEIDAYVKLNAESGYHLCGTCRMGVDDAAVCSPDLSVRGVEGIRVIDASVFPDEPSANTNAPTFMVAERASDLLLGKSLPPQDARFYVNPTFATSQR